MRPARSLLLKRAVDLVAAGILLVLLAPLYLAVAAAVLLVDGRPMLFRQPRPGRHGKPFTILKFRTMQAARDARGPTPADEARLTALGRFLRSTSLDELPEMLNVLRGEMSLVGPRPLMMEYLPLYSPEQARRHEVLPGITGWAQVNGRNALGWDERFALDVWYVDNRSFWLDLKILALTVVTVFRRQGISASGHATMPMFTGPAPGHASLIVHRLVLDRARRSHLPRRRRRMLARFAAVALVAEAAAIAFVALIDPYGITSLATVPGVNMEKTQRLDGGGRIERSLRLWLADHKTLILGGAAARDGLDPAGPVLAGDSAYNAGVAAATMAEIYAIGQFALQHERPERVIIGLEFAMFEADRASNGDFEASGFDGDPMPFVYARSLLAPEAFVDALRTVYDNLQGRQGRDQRDGFQATSARPGYDYRKAFTAILAEKYLVSPRLYADFDYDPKRVDLLRDLMSRLAAAGIETHLFVSPVHARQLEAITTMGLLPVYESWLRSLAATADAVNAGTASVRPVALWDFSGYNTVTVEDVPDPSDARHDMAWYWNSSHYTSAAGELILATMLGRSAGGAAPPPDFGVRLGGATVEAVLAERRAARIRYVATHPEEVVDVERLVIQTASKRHQRLQACCI